MTLLSFGPPWSKAGAVQHHDKQDSKSKHKYHPPAALGHYYFPACRGALVQRAVSSPPGRGGHPGTGRN